MPARPRFYTLKDVSDVLNVSPRLVRALLISGDLRGIQVGGRGEWRIEHDELEKYIDRQYQATDRMVESDRTAESSESESRSDHGDLVENDNSTTS